jgi:hypothetical protein
MIAGTPLKSTTASTTQRTFAAEEALAGQPRVRAALVWLADRAVDQPKVGDGGVLLEDLCVDEGRQNNLNAIRSLRSQHDLHERGSWSPGRTTRRVLVGGRMLSCSARCARRRCARPFR